MSNPLWTDDRCEEFEALDTLLNEVKALNSGSHFIQRVEKCINIAERLTAFDYEGVRQHFTSFLRDCAIENRRANGLFKPSGSDSADAQTK